MSTEPDGIAPVARNADQLSDDHGSDPTAPPVSRRGFLTGGAVGIGLGAVLGSGAATGIITTRAAREPDTFGRESLPCHGPHQAGIVSAPRAHTRYLCYSLRPETDAEALRRMFRILTGDIEGLTTGEAPLADPEPELAAQPARLSITVGIGPELVNRVDPGLRPSWLAPLPEFSLDRLGNGFDGGDLLLALQADDPLPIAHAARMFDRDLASFATPLWRQQGYRQARGAASENTTMRNLMGQVDGTVNPSASDEEEMASLVWLGEESGWLHGGSAFVLRRIRMELDTWDIVDRPGREQTIGRRLSDGAPLTAEPGEGEHTPADFDAKNAIGLPVIARDSHMRRAHSEDPAERILRHSLNYEDGTESGLLFGCYQRDPTRQFVPIQQRLDEADLLNEWITHTGSAVFAILPGFRRGHMLGASLLA